MKVILQKDMPALGRKQDVKEVSPGYARNFLFPRKLAIPATDSALGALATVHAQKEEARAAETAKYRAIAEKMRTTPISFQTRMGEKGKAFGSISASKITEELAKHGIAVQKEWIELNEPIKTAGEKKVAVKFPHGVTGEARITIAAE